MISAINCHHLALSQFLHAAYFQSTAFEETALELYSHKRTMWQEAVMIDNAKKEKTGRVCAEGNLSPPISLIPSFSPQPWTCHRLGASSDRCWQKSQHQSPMNFSSSFFFFCTYFIYFWPPRQYLTMTSTISLCISFFESSRVCSLGQ